MAKVQVSVLVDEEILLLIDDEAERLARSRNWVINKRLGYFIHAGFDPLWEVTRSGELEGELKPGRVVRTSVPKKIADISAGGGATEGGGDPCLPRGGKAQDGGNNPDGPHLLTAKDGSTAYCDPRSCKWCANGKPSNRDVEPEGGWDICGTCGQVHGAGEYFNHNFVNRKKSEEKGDGAKGSREAGQDRGSVGGDSKANPEGDDVTEGGTVANGKPRVNMQVLRDICAGKMPRNAQEAMAESREYERPDPHEVDLCGFKSYNEGDGEWYVCTKEKHGPKIKHGEWLKV